MVAATTEKLESYNAWGLVQVADQTVTVILSAMSAGRPINRTIKREIKRPMGFNGSALVAVDIQADGFQVGVHEIGETLVIGHPEVDKVLKDAVDFVRKSAGL